MASRAGLDKLCRSYLHASSGCSEFNCKITVWTVSTHALHLFYMMQQMVYCQEYIIKHFSAKKPWYFMICLPNVVKMPSDIRRLLSSSLESRKRQRQIIHSPYIGWHSWLNVVASRAGLDKLSQEHVSHCRLLCVLSNAKIYIQIILLSCITFLFICNCYICLWFSLLHLVLRLWLKDRWHYFNSLWQKATLELLPLEP